MKTRLDTHSHTEQSKSKGHSRHTASLKSNYEGAAQQQNIGGAEIHFSS